MSKQIRNCKINTTGEIFTYRANGIWKDLSLTPYSSETKLYTQRHTIDPGNAFFYPETVGIVKQEVAEKSCPKFDMFEPNEIKSIERFTILPRAAKYAYITHCTMY